MTHRHGEVDRELPPCSSGMGNIGTEKNLQRLCNAVDRGSEGRNHDPQDIRRNTDHITSPPLSSRFGQGTALVLAAMTLAAPLAANAASPSHNSRQMADSTASAAATSGLEPIENVEVNATRDGRELQVEVVALDRAGETIAHQSIVIAGDGRFDIAGYYQLDGEWHGQFTSTMGRTRVATSELTQQEARTVQAQLEFAIEKNNDPQKGIIGCGLGVVGTTGTCGGLAGIPGAGWFACGLAIAATTCACFEEEIGC